MTRPDDGGRGAAGIASGLGDRRRRRFLRRSRNGEVPLLAGAGNGRIPPSGRIRDLGLINWLVAKSAARTVGAPQMHLFSTLGQHKRLFLAMLPYSGALLRGRLPSVDTELVILRVAHLRASDYELQHHRRLGRRRGLDEQTQQSIFSWPAESAGLTPRQQALLSATDEFITERSISDATWQQLAAHLDRRQLIEFCMLAGQYDGLAATMSALEIPLDHPPEREPS
jgi:alkylhydroperoxidase family enzyme